MSIQSIIQLIIRKETPADYYATEHMVLRAFWNIHDPGCNEHLLVHKLRTAEDYLPELSRVAELDGRIVGAIFYSRAKVVDGNAVHEILTFGPLAVEPTCCNLGIGATLLEETTALAKAAGYPGIVILGEPDYYPKHGFRTCDHFGIVHPDIGNCDPFMALPLNERFAEVHGFFYESPVFSECEDEAEIAAFTKGFPYYEPLKLPCQWLHAEKLGRISAVESNRYLIRFWEQELPARLDGAFHGSAPGWLPAVGDYVTFHYHRDGDSAILAVWEREGDPLPYRRLTRYLPVLETDETLYDEENGYSEVIFRFMEDLELACEKEPDNETLQTIKQIFDREENDPGHIIRHLGKIIRALKALET